MVLFWSGVLVGWSGFGLEFWSGGLVLAIKDASSSSVKAFLQYLYTNELVDECNVEDLLKLAHRYEANSLLKVCASAIVETMSRANVVSCVATLRPEEEEVELDIPGEEPALPQNREAAGHSTELRNGAKTFVEPEHPPHVT